VANHPTFRQPGRQWLDFDLPPLPARVDRLNRRFETLSEAQRLGAILLAIIATFAASLYFLGMASTVMLNRAELTPPSITILDGPQTLVYEPTPTALPRSTPTAVVAVLPGAPTPVPDTGPRRAVGAGTPIAPPDVPSLQQTSRFVGLAPVQSSSGAAAAPAAPAAPERPRVVGTPDAPIPAAKPTAGGFFGGQVALTPIRATPGATPGVATGPTRPPGTVVATVGAGGPPITPTTKPGRPAIPFPPGAATTVPTAASKPVAPPLFNLPTATPASKPVAPSFPPTAAPAPPKPTTPPAPKPTTPPPTR
jgi:hypothetical protein